MTRLDELVSVAGGVAVVLVPVRRYPTRTDQPADSSDDTGGQGRTS